MNIKDLLKNKAQDGTYCEKVVGSTPRVHQMAGFIEKNATLLHLITANATLEYMEDEDFTKEEFIAFKKGVAAVGLFMSKCLQEREMARMKNRMIEEA